MLEAGGVLNAQMGLEGVTGIEELPTVGNGASARSVSFPRLLDGRLSFWRTASSWRRSDKLNYIEGWGVCKRGKEKETNWVLNLNKCKEQNNVYLPLASSFSLWTDSSRFSFSSNSLSRKAFLSITWFMRCSKSSSDMMVTLWQAAKELTTGLRPSGCERWDVKSLPPRTFWSSPGHRWPVPALWCISAGDLSQLWFVPTPPPELRCAWTHQSAAPQISPANSTKTSQYLIQALPLF